MSLIRSTKQPSQRASPVLFWLSVVCSIALLYNTPCSAQEARLDTLRRELISTEQQLDQLSSSVEAHYRSSDSLELYSSWLLDAQNDIESSLDDLRRFRKESQQRLDELGDAPEEGQPEESDVVSALRTELNDYIATVEGLEQQFIDLNESTNKLIQTVARHKKRLFFHEVTHRSHSILSPSLWKEAFVQIPLVKRQLLFYYNEWKSDLLAKKDFQTSIFLLFVTVISITIMLYLVSRNSVWRSIDALFYEDGEPTKTEKKRRASVTSMAVFFFLGMAFVLLYWTGRSFELINDYNSIFFIRLFFSITITFFLIRYLRSALSPITGMWRLIPCNDFYARRIVLLFSLIYITFIIERGPSTGIELVYEVAVELILVLSGLGGLIIHSLIIYLTRKKFWVNVAAQNGSENNLKREIIRKSFRLSAILMIAAAIIGYIRLSSFMAHRFVLLTFFMVFILALRELLAWGLLSLQSIGYSESRDVDDETESKSSIQFWIRVILDISLPIVFFPLLLLLLGFDQLDIERTYAFFDSTFHIGAIRFSMTNLIYGIAIFFLTIILTRLITSGFERRILSRRPFDPGLRNSVMTLLNYLGMLIAILVSLSIIGIDFSKIALIAGALSVGIGFGLQSIVSNFVSGLILLFERPIKIGDWVVVNSGQGHVKHIGARATQIETFDRSTIIVPNSELVSSSLTNWFYSNRRGRIIIPVGVAYDSDPEKVREVLKEAAANHPAVLKSPAPIIFWADFAESSLNFELRVYVRDIDEILHIQTDLRFAIFKGLKEAGISIPFPQRDVHFFPKDQTSKEIPTKKTKMEKNNPPENDSKST